MGNQLEGENETINNFLYSLKVLIYVQLRSSINIDLLEEITHFR